MAVEPVVLTRMQSVRKTLMQYGASAYLRSNFFSDIPVKVWNAQVEPKRESFVANPNFVGYSPQGPLEHSFETSLNTLSNLIIKLQDENV